MSHTRDLRPVYEWRWKRAGKQDMATRNPRIGARLARFAAKFGGTVERMPVGFSIPYRHLGIVQLADGSLEHKADT